MHKYKLRQVPRFFGTNWCAIVVPIQVIRWYRQCYDGTDSCAIVVQIRRYCHYRLSCLQRCISFESYIKPQLAPITPLPAAVVYLLNPTSNHNASFSLTLDSALYIFWILHQTTTWAMPWYISMSCISFESYIKPQLLSWVVDAYKVVYLLNPTSNHNRPSVFSVLPHVVYLLNPTSNHNTVPSATLDDVLYIFWILHQTTTAATVLQLLDELYIFWILHQTTTVGDRSAMQSRCISFESYIKPQRPHRKTLWPKVVYLLNPTSNHNLSPSTLVYKRLYIFWILHQTTTGETPITFVTCCISFESYIKPQRIVRF